MISASLQPAAVFNKTLARVINRAERFPLPTRPSKYSTSSFVKFTDIM